MKRVLIIGGAGVTPDGKRVFHDYAQGVSHILAGEAKVLFTRINNLQVVIEPGRFAIFDTHHKTELDAFDLIALHGQIRQYRDMVYVLSRFCAWHGIPYFNDFSQYYPGTKLGQTVIFLESGAPFIKTLYAFDNDQLLKLIEKELQPPFVLKQIDGTRGEANYLVNSVAEAKRSMLAHPDLVFIAQAYCPNDRDYRLLLSPKGLVSFERRGRPDTHLNNTSQGGMAALSPDAVPVAVIGHARHIAERLGLSLAGVDVMPHLTDGAFYFLEVNSQPQLFTGALLEEKAAFTRELFLGLLNQ